jgi:menaquinone-dependent protoporphyrinogen oxidase
MSLRILVAYASRKGSTAEIAQAIGKELQSGGYTVDIAEMTGISSIEDYNVVIIGAPIYMGRIVSDMGTFIKRFGIHLKKIPVAAFAVGIAPKSTEPDAVVHAMKTLRVSVASLQPVAETVFAGKLDPTKLSFFQRKMTEIVKSPVGDFRDWDAIATWGRSVAVTIET